MFSAWSWLVLGVLLVVWVPLVGIVWLATVPFDRGRYAAGWLFRQIAVVHQKLNPLWRFRTRRARCRPDPRRPYVVVANHESFVDILLISHLPWEMKWLSKAEFFKFPFVGWLMRMAGDIRLDRGDKKAGAHGDEGVRRPARQACLGDDLPRGNTLGDRRAADVQGRRLPARHRPAAAGPAARRARHPHGAAQARLAVRRRDADVYVLDPIETTGLTSTDVPMLRERVRGGDRRRSSRRSPERVRLER